jgi:hypothetical protein
MTALFGQGKAFFNWGGAGLQIHRAHLRGDEAAQRYDRNLSGTPGINVHATGERVIGTILLSGMIRSNLFKKNSWFGPGEAVAFG